MITVLIFGEKDSSFTGFIQKALRNFGNVSLAGESKIDMSERCDFLLLEKSCDTSVAGNNIIALFGQAVKKTLKISGQIIAVVESDNKNALDILSKNAQKTVCCSMSSKDTISIASITDENAVVSLQREITDLSGKTVEPHDMKILLSKKTDPYYICAAYAVLLLSGLAIDAPSLSF